MKSHISFYTNGLVIWHGFPDDTLYVHQHLFKGTSPPPSFSHGCQKV